MLLKKTEKLAIAIAGAVFRRVIYLLNQSH